MGLRCLGCGVLRKYKLIFTFLFIPGHSGAWQPIKQQNSQFIAVFHINICIILNEYLLYFS